MKTKAEISYQGEAVLECLSHLNDHLPSKQPVPGIPKALRSGGKLKSSCFFFFSPDMEFSPQ